jgi:hypothetical protein
MNKQLTFTVTIEFEDSVYDDNEFNEVAENILSGLIHQVDHAGLAPEESETFTKSIQISKDGEDIVRYSYFPL